MLPVLVLLLLAILQVGLVAKDVVLVHHAAREAARAAATDARAVVARRAAEAAGGLAGDRLQVRLAGDTDPGGRLEVRVRYRIPTDVPLVGRLVGDRTATATVTMRVE